MSLTAAAAADVAQYCGDELSSRDQRHACVARLAALDVPLSTLVSVNLHFIAIQVLPEALI